LLGEIVDRTLHELPDHISAVISLLKFLLGNIVLIQCHVEVTLRLLDRPMGNLIELPFLLERKASMGLLPC
jgi:hypothetical protein